MVELFLGYFITSFVTFNLMSLFYNLPIFISTQFFPTLSSFRRVLSAPPKSAGNNIPDFADSRW
jgi:hypothetical protein